MDIISNKINDIKSGYGCVKVYAGIHTEHTMIYIDGVRVDENAFTWKMLEDKNEIREKQTAYYLTLNDLSSQFFTKRRHGVLTVVAENETSGTIYQIGRHNETIWEKHGTTNGYS